MAESNEKIPVTVAVPPRPDFKGYWSLGRSRPGHGVFFQTGKTDIEVTPKELAELKEEEASGYLLVVEYSPAERAARLAANAADAAKAAEADAEAALVAAQEKADLAKKAKAEAEAVAERSAKGGKAKGKAQPEGDAQ
jgi:hypothetical protein